MKYVKLYDELHILQELQDNYLNEKKYNLEDAAGGFPYTITGSELVITEPMDDKTKERMIKKAKKYGFSAKPNMQGGINIYEGKVNEGWKDEHGYDPE